MADFVIICGSKRETEELAKKTAEHIRSFNHHCRVEKTRLIVRDVTANESARFITMRDITDGRDRGLKGIRYEGCKFEKALDEAIKRKQEENKL